MHASDGDWAKIGPGTEFGVARKYEVSDHW
jgi:hypothetical protein